LVVLLSSFASPEAPLDSNVDPTEETSSDVGSCRIGDVVEDEDGEEEATGALNVVDEAAILLPDAINSSDSIVSSEVILNVSPH
jgi:hypothetical protein